MLKFGAYTNPDIGTVPRCRRWFNLRLFRYEMRFELITNPVTLGASSLNFCIVDHKGWQWMKYSKVLWRRPPIWETDTLVKIE